MTIDIETTPPGTCPASTKTGPCRAKPKADAGYCIFHGPLTPDLKGARPRGGRLAQAGRTLSKARVKARAEAGADPGALLPSLESIGAMTGLLSTVFKKTADREYSPQQAAAMIAALRLGKDLLTLGLEVRLLEEREKLDTLAEQRGKH